MRGSNSESDVYGRRILTSENGLKGFNNKLTISILSSKAKRHYLLTLKVSSYCLFVLQSRSQVGRCLSLDMFSVFNTSALQGKPIPELKNAEEIEIAQQLIMPEPTLHHVVMDMTTMGYIDAQAVTCLGIVSNPANTKHLYNIYTMLD